ncbi:MAG TPA: hypothetical protein PLU33_04430 [Treponemataceae bacterium]|nr:hypothetical protein [Treponemataceae bacterium]HQL04360.1 hypothetical protein [Treponemataceae bacterium]
MIQTKNKILAAIIITGLILLVISCSAVFSAGVSGRVVDSESTSTPKDGIPDVTVFAYIDEAARDADFDAWTAGSRFSPATTEHYIGQTSTTDDGSFTIGRIVWESKSPEFGKTADFTPVFLLFYHENFGLVKNTNNAVIMSDSTSNVIYQEMTSVRKSTSLDIQIRNASSDALLNTAVNTKVSVPQLSGTVEYEISVTGSSSLLISYPRFASDGITPYTPEVSITYSQLGSDIDYKACNFNAEENLFTFLETPSVTKTVSGSTYPVRLYMKTRNHAMSSMSGQITYGNPGTGSRDEGTTADDNVIIMLAYKTGGKFIQYSESSAKVRTSSSGDGANGTRIRHGLFSGLGQGISWINETYDGKYDTKTIYIVVDKDNDEKISIGDFYYEKTVRSDEDTANLGILSSGSHEVISAGQL